MGCNWWMQLSGDALERSPVLLSRFLTLRDVRNLLGKAEAALHASQGGEEITSERVQVRCCMGCGSMGGVHAASCRHGMVAAFFLTVPHVTVAAAFC